LKLANVVFSPHVAYHSRESQGRCADSVTQAVRGYVTGWLFPLNPPSSGDGPVYDRVKPVHVPGSHATYTEVQLNDRFSAPGWFPQAHSAMPEIVAHGRKPDVYACGYCHTPGGQGRPENASLAGLPAGYIIQQVTDFKNGTRHSAGPSAYAPTDLMIHVAEQATPGEVAVAATYFSQQRPVPRVRVVERERVPQSRVVGWVYVAVPGGGDEPLGTRLMEFAPDASRHESRDDAMEYVAYAPVGSLKRGHAIALAGADNRLLACVSCHGNRLQGVGLVPRIAGRSPTYLIRQLLAFQTGNRTGATAQPMLPVVAKLSIGDMIDVAAYAASLTP
jgi:cytochrome c553